MVKRQEMKKVEGKYVGLKPAYAIFIRVRLITGKR